MGAAATSPGIGGLTSKRTERCLRLTCSGRCETASKSAMYGFGDTERLRCGDAREVGASVE
eukprot:4864666-Pleurochrysis_carterae.AAC.1